jgi:DNA-binding response OmpR family regulator
MNGVEVLIVEDDEAIAAGLALNLKLEGCVPQVVGDGEGALARLREARFDLVLLDISLPGISGLDVLASLRAGDDLTPVIVLSARRDEFDKVAALRLGADDYVTKPFALAEVLARMTAVLRRAGGRPPPAPPAEQFRFADVLVDLRTRVVTRDGKPVKLTHLELELLAHFLRHPGEVFTREQLLRQVWALSSGSRRTVDNFVAQLRAKLERDPEAPRHLVTVRGTGYRFDAGN